MRKDCTCTPRTRCKACLRETISYLENRNDALERANEILQKHMIEKTQELIALKASIAEQTSNASEE